MSRQDSRNRQMSLTGAALSVRGLGKRFGDRVAFEGISFEIGAGGSSDSSGRTVRGRRRRSGRSARSSRRHRVAIVSTTMRMIGRPDELRDRLFARTLRVRTLAPLPDPGQVLSGLPAVESWRRQASGVRGPELLAQLLFSPLIAGWSIWVGIAISTRASEVRVAQQLGMLANLPPVAVTSLIAFNLIRATAGVAAVAAAALLLLDVLGWRVVSAAFDRERLIAGTR